jgi:hypothetical protein
MSSLPLPTPLRLAAEDPVDNRSGGSVEFGAVSTEESTAVETAEDGWSLRSGSG